MVLVLEFELGNFLARKKAKIRVVLISSNKISHFRKMLKASKTFWLVNFGPKFPKKASKSPRFSARLSFLSTEKVREKQPFLYLSSGLLLIFSVKSTAF